MQANDSARRDPRALFVAGVVLLAASAVTTAFERVNPIELREFIEWRSPVDARRAAIDLHRPILYAFVEEGDPRSAQMEREIFADAKSAGSINRHYIPVRVVDERNRGRANSAVVSSLVAQFGITRMPAIAVTDADGAHTTLLGGYRGGLHAMQFLEGAARNAVEANRADDPRRKQVEALSRIGSARSASFSPDGRRVAFVSDLSGQPQLWTIGSEGGFPEQVTTMPDGVGGAQWSPTGEWIAFTSPPPGTGVPEIYVAHPDGTGLRRITSGNGDRNLMSFWTRDGLLPVSVLRKTTPGMESLLVDPGTGTSRLLLQNPQFGVIVDANSKRALLIQQDGAIRSTSVRYLDSAQRPLLLSRGENEEMYGSLRGEFFLGASNHGRDRSAFVRVSLSLGAPTETLWARDDADLEDVAVSADGSRAALVWNADGLSELALFDLRSGSREIIPAPALTIRGLHFSQEGRMLLVGASDARHPVDVWLLDIDSRRFRQLTRSAHAGIDLASLIAPELVHFRAHDGLPLSGWLYRAPAPRGTVISLHGGPMLQELPEMNPTYQALLANGISVFAPNVRGSAGFGRRFLARDDGPRRFDALRDVESAARFLLDSGTALPNRLGVMGKSYGGWLTLASIAAYPKLFAAAVDECGMADLRRMETEASSDVAKMLEAEYGRDERLLARLSPDLTLVRTPLLVLHGARDTQVRPWHSDHVAQTLRARGVEVDYLVFPEEGHGFRIVANRVTAADKIARWFAGHLGSGRP